VQKLLRQALLYGYLNERGGRLYHPGGNLPVCSRALADRMVKVGFILKNGQRYELTDEGRRALGQLN
jgi:ribosomal protein S19E (S16A)